MWQWPLEEGDTPGILGPSLVASWGLPIFSEGPVERQQVQKSYLYPLCDLGSQSALYPKGKLGSHLELSHLVSM
jgi:hypothetical protein